jgi:hypothetical protein
MPHEVTAKRLPDPKDFFVCQIQDPSKVEAWSAERNPNWREPARHWCAMACLSGVLRAEGVEAPSLEHLFERACANGVYRPDPERVWRGAYHENLADFVNEEICSGLVVACRSVPIVPRRGHTSTSTLARLLRQGFYVLLSVSPDIRFPSSKDQPREKRGHFVLVHSFSEIDGVGYFRLNNPAGYQSENSQIDMHMSAKRLAELSFGDCVAIRSRKFDSLLR